MTMNGLLLCSEVPTESRAINYTHRDTELGGLGWPHLEAIPPELPGATPTGLQLLISVTTELKRPSDLETQQTSCQGGLPSHHPKLRLTVESTVAFGN